MKKLLIIISLSFLTACGGGSSSAVQGLNVPGNISMVPSN